MSAVDPNISGLDANGLFPASVDLSAWPQDVTRIPQVPETEIETGELFIFALTLEGRMNPRTCAFAERLWFQINPQEFSWTQTRSIGTYDIIGGPQATQLGQMQVRTWQLSSFFPEIYEDDYCIPVPSAARDRNPQQSIEWLQLAQMAGYPLQFMSVPLRDSRSVFGTVKVVISSVTSSLRAGSPLDVYFDLELTELKEPTIIKTAATTVAGPAWKFKKYVTQPGDKLWDIARKAYGTPYGSLWGQIKAANKTVIYGGKKHSLRNSKRKVVKHSNEVLLTSQHLVIPKPKSVPR